MIFVKTALEEVNKFVSLVDNDFRRAINVFPDYVQYQYVKNKDNRFNCVNLNFNQKSCINQVCFLFKKVVSKKTFISVKKKFYK